MTHEKLLEHILASDLNKPGRLFDCFAVESMLEGKDGVKPEPYPISCAIPVLVALGKLIRVATNNTHFYGCTNPVVRVTMPHENVRASVLRRMAYEIANPPPKQMQLF